MRARRRDRGQAFIETAVVSMFLVIVLLGIIGFGRLFQASIQIEAAARDGARAATMGKDNAGVRDAVLANLAPDGSRRPVGEVAIMINPPSDTNRPFNSNVKVEVWWKYPVPVPLFNLIVRDRLLYSAKTMVVTTGV